MLTYAFDLLVLIYEEEGYAANDIPALILRHNLHGLEICPRAAQLAELALVFKAREKSRRFFQPEHIVRPAIIELREVRFAENELPDYIRALGLGDLFQQPLLKLLHQFEEAKNFGSLIQPCLDERTIAEVRRAIEGKDLGGQLFLRETHLKVLRVLEQAEALTQRYHVVVANPPYMGSGAMNPALKELARTQFPDSKTDCFSMFIERGFGLALQGGWSAMVTMQSWMFLGSFEKLRIKLLADKTIHAAVHMANMVMGIAFGTVACVWENRKRTNYLGSFSFVDFEDISELGSPVEFPVKNKRLARVASEEFACISGSPIAYWISPKMRGCFQGLTFGEHLCSEGAVKTGNNSKFIRMIWEVGHKSVGKDGPWRKHPKGGPFRKWYGNLDCIVRWTQEARRHYREDFIARIPVESIWNVTGITWTAVSSGELSFRLKLEDEIPNNAALLIYPKEASHLLAELCGLNSSVTPHFLQVLSPTLNYLVGDVLAIPFPSDRAVLRDATTVGEELVSIARVDWDNFETSWDFRDPPLLRPGLKGATLEASWRNWEAQSTAAIRRMQELETENNRLFIAAYGLEGELQPEVPEEQITLARADVRRDMAAFLSYAVGVMFGRYSLEVPGLVLANAGDTLDDYWRIVRTKDEGRRMNDEGKPAAAADLDLSLPSQSFNLQPSSFIPDPDGILPVLDGEWFEDDIVLRTREFLRVTFGEATLNENVQFIEHALGKDLRSYFQDDFFKNHLTGERAYGYKNRPIYWLFSSGKQKAFQCLVYLHRYTPGTLSRIRTDYAIPLQGKLSARITRLDEEIPNTTSSAARKKLQTELDKAKKQLVELLAYDEQLRSYADQRIALDLDDGVKVNYAKFGPLVADAKKVCGKKED